MEHIRLGIVIKTEKVVVMTQYPPKKGQGYMSLTNPSIYVTISKVEVIK